ncbi:MAG: hypothetical protein R3B13_17885 [Polyangiaceae bacterium]
MTAAAENSGLDSVRHANSMETKPANDIASVVADLVSRALAVSGQPPGSEWLDVATALGNLPGVDEVDRLRFRHREHKIHVGRWQHLEVTTRALVQVAPLSLSIAPEVVTSFSAGRDHGVLILRYAACSGERLARVSDTLQPLHEDAVAALRRDMQTLISHGLVHPYVRGTVHWLVSSERGILVLDDWYALARCTAEEGREALGEIDRAAQRHAARVAARTGAAPTGDG